MIFGRPTNLWLGLTSALSGAVASTAILAFHADPVITGALAGVWQTVLGAVIALVGNQPPTLNPGDTYRIQTPAGQPNTTSMVTPPEPVSVQSTSVSIQGADDVSPTTSTPAQDVKLDG